MRAPPLVASFLTGAVVAGRSKMVAEIRVVLVFRTNSPVWWRVRDRKGRATPLLEPHILVDSLKPHSLQAERREGLWQ